MRRGLLTLVQARSDLLKSSLSSMLPVSPTWSRSFSLILSSISLMTAPEDTEAAISKSNSYPFGNGTAVVATSPTTDSIAPIAGATKVYPKRYFILIMFVLLSASNAMQWIEYSIIAHIITEFYGVSYGAVDWTSMIYMLSYMILVFPGR